MIRRVHVPSLLLGPNRLPIDQAHHLRDVLRLEPGTIVELFDSSGNVGCGPLEVGDDGLDVELASFTRASASALRLVIASAVPKGDRADWLVEKLSELGVAEWQPLAAERSVVLPTGRGKADRWTRIAVESAKQSRRAGVMSIGNLVSVEHAMASRDGMMLVASTAPGGDPLRLVEVDAQSATVFIGPEGGWTDAELERFAAAKARPISLTATVLRLETAAVAAAAVLLCR